MAVRQTLFWTPVSRYAEEDQHRMRGVPPSSRCYFYSCLFLRFVIRNYHTYPEHTPLTPFQKISRTFFVHSRVVSACFHRSHGRFYMAKRQGYVASITASATCGHSE